MKLPSVWPILVLSSCALTSAHAQERDVIVQMPPSPRAAFVPPTPGSCPQLKYPTEALRYELEGATIASLFVDASGKVYDTRLGKSSGWKLLDETTLAGLAACGVKPVDPAAPADAPRRWIKMEYVWTLYNADEVRPVMPVLVPDSCAVNPELIIVGSGDNTRNTIYLRFLTSKEGQVYGVKLEQGINNRAAEEAAIANVQSCRYAPGMVAGKPAFSNATIRYRYARSGQAGVVELPTLEQKDAAMWSTRVLARYRYKSDGAARAGAITPFDAYLKALDGERMLFTRQEIAAMDALRPKLDKIVDGSELDSTVKIFNAYLAKLAQRVAFSKQVLQSPMDFTGADHVASSRAQAPWAESDETLHALWRKQVMADYLSLRLAGAKEDAASATLERRYDKHLAYAQSLAGADVFQTFMNAYAQSFDPHARYVGPATRTDADVVREPGAAASVAGLGLTVQKQGDFIVIVDLLPGGGAAQSTLLKRGDRIVGVAESAGRDMVSLIGAKVDEAVALLRGVVGSTAALEIVPGDAPVMASRKRVEVVRKPRAPGLDDARAKGDVVVQPGSGRRIGVIELRTLYQDFEAKKRGEANFASVSRDVATILQRFRIDKVDAVLLDLRGNGGGSLDEATRLAGLFVAGAPIVQQRNFDGTIRTEHSPGEVAAWDGALGVLIDKGSSAGTEVVAAAIQDYGRGIVIGDRSDGRGSVQTLISLDRFAKDKGEALGELKMTVAQLFRIHGAPIQRLGVVPDIAMSDVAEVAGGTGRGDDYLELPIKPVQFSKRGELGGLLPALSARHLARTAHDPRYQAMVRAQADATAQQVAHEVSLNQAAREKLRDARVSVYVSTVQFDEALRVLNDEVELLRADPTLAKAAGVSAPSPSP